MNRVGRDPSLCRQRVLGVGYRLVGLVYSEPHVSNAGAWSRAALRPDQYPL